MTAYIAALRTAYDILLAHMAAEGGVPMTDELARAVLGWVGSWWEGWEG